ncbi:hypothetical protein F5Y18DRAFT_271473 [Xylariaceae sp. FL1019]|nr:hypothetical protein F5Y18DRAFT_271473 [Xylariaceae sp. FL1019]
MEFTATGKGLMFVNSKIGEPDILSESQFLKWYDEDHIPEALRTSGMNSGYRCLDIEHVKGNKVERPYLCLYQIDDLAFLRTTEFKSIGVTSPLLPTSDPVFEFVDFDVRYAKLVETYDPTNKGPGKTGSVLVAILQAGDNLTDEEIDRWYREEHIPGFNGLPGFLRATRYETVFGRANRDFDEQQKMSGNLSVPKHITIYEFETPGIDMEAVLKKGGTEWTKKVVAGCSFVSSSVFQVARLHGDKTLHHGITL